MHSQILDQHIMNAYGIYMQKIDADYSRCIYGYGSAPAVTIELKCNSYDDYQRFFTLVNESITLHEELIREEAIRANHPTLLAAYEEYKLLLKLVDSDHK